ncbi:MAG: hypothetical protein ACXWUN_05560 [Allosphingosinicella sp.]
MAHFRSPLVAGLTSAISLVVPVVVTMLYLHLWDWMVLALVTLMSVPFFYLARNRILLESHPGWRGDD